MKTEITMDRLREYIGPSQPRADENIHIAELEIYPKGISKLEEKLERRRNRHLFTKNEWRRLTFPKSRWYEHIIATVCFSNNMKVTGIGMEVISDFSCLILEPEKLLNDEEKQNIIHAAKRIVRKKHYNRSMEGLAHAV